MANYEWVNSGSNYEQLILSRLPDHSYPRSLYDRSYSHSLLGALGNYQNKELKGRGRPNSTCRNVESNFTQAFFNQKKRPKLGALGGRYRMLRG